MSKEVPNDPTPLLELAADQVGSHALVLLDTTGRVTAWMAGAQRIFGWKAEEMVGRSIAALFVPEDLARGVDAWERETALEAGTSEDDRWQLRKDGARIWVSGALNVLKDGAGVPIGFAKVMRARTDQKEQLEAVEARLAALQRAEGRRVEFVSTLAHELRNPLGAIGNVTSMLERVRDASPEVRFAASVISRQVDFMARLIGDLLDVARSAAGKVQLNLERIVLQQVINRSLEACRSQVQQRSHLVHRLMPKGDIELDADPVRLQQVFVNLIENAAKYTPDRGTIWIKVTTEGDEAVVHVRDTGVGMSADLMPHIFELFTQGERADREGRPQAGLGIGLALVRDTVTMHGGTVQATSDGEGRGSQFTVRLPLPAR